MVNELVFKLRSALNVLVLRWHLARARHVGRRLLAKALTILALPALAVLYALEAVLTAAVNIVVLAAWLVILRNQ